MPIDDIKRLFQKPLVVTKAIGSANKCRPFYAMNVISLKENVKAGSFAHEVAHALCDRNNFGKGLQICASNVILKGYEVVTLNKDGRNLHIVTSPYFVEPYQGRLYASDDDLKRILAEVFLTDKEKSIYKDTRNFDNPDISKDNRNVIYKVRDCIASGVGQNKENNGTALALINGITTYYQNSRDYRSDMSKFKCLTEGEAKLKTQKAFDLVNQLI